MAVAQPQKIADEQDVVRQDAWINAMQNLIAQVEQWAQAKGWGTERRTEELEEGIGPYPVPILTVTTPAGSVALEPIGRLIIGAEGRIDFYEVRSMARIMLLLRPNDKWIVRTDSGINWPNPWGQETFYQIVEGLLDPE